MNDFEKLENDFYISKYGLPTVGNSQELWNKIKKNKELLWWSIKPVKDKFNERYLVKGLSICDTMLSDYWDVDKDVYQELINVIYSNKDIARIVQNGYSNGGYSYLLMSLWNPGLKLANAQKEFAVSEAMNKIGTVKYQQDQKQWEEELKRKGITDNETTYINLDGSINPIGMETKSQYMYSLFYSLSNTQAHGQGAFDIRYWILRNNNWTVEEKKQLINDFWYDDEEYTACLDEWEWAIVNDSSNYKQYHISQFDSEMLYDYSKEQLLEFYGDQETTDRIWKEIEFCRLMNGLRPKYYLLEDVKTLII